MIESRTMINIKRISVTTEDANPRSFRWTTLTKLKAKATISKGSEVECRKLNTVYGIEKSEDIVTGYEIETESQTVEAEILALVDGGVVLEDEEGQVIGYEAPKSGDSLDRIPFTISFYAENKDTDGSTKNYMKVTFRNCKGKPMSWEFEDGKFSVPRFQLTSSPKIGESPIKIEFVDSMD